MPDADRTRLLRRSATGVVGAVAVLAAHAAAQQQSLPAEWRFDPPTATAVRADTRGEIHLDGRLDEAVWLAAPVVAEFVQVQPVDGSEPSQRTEVRVAYDGAALYIGARMFDSEPEAISRRLGRRDSDVASDVFTVVVDSYHDHRTSFRFRVTPSGVRMDDVTANDDMSGDMSWDPVWEVATRVDSLGWVAEIRVPFSQLRFSGAEEQVWGINFTRFVFRTNELVRWSWYPNTEEGFASLFGHLEGLRGLQTPRRFEVLPYTVASTDHQEGRDAADPFNDGSLQNATVGLDVKYGLTSELTLDATVNPDFGQVEADPAVVNLTAFETFFEERRPFFVEGANLFQFGAGSGGFVFGAPQLFYSRRVGRAPSRYVVEPGGFADNPLNTSILGAAKLSGQTNGWSIGVLEALTAPEHANVQRADLTTGTEPAEPLANFGVVSVRRDLRGGASGLGILATSVVRDLNDPVFSGLNSSAYSGGVDYFHRFGRNQYAINGSFSASHIVGDPAAITRAQRSSGRYFQRPDQDYVSVDSAASNMTGFAASLQAGKVSGNWTWGTDIFAYSPRFEINDAGFETTVDRIFHGVRVQRRWLRPGRVFRQLYLGSTWAQNWNFGGVLVGRSAYLGAYGQFLNYWSAEIGTNQSFRARTDKATRGGPLMQQPRSWNLNGSVSSDYRRTVSGTVALAYARNEYEGWGYGAAFQLSARLSSAVTFSITPQYEETQAKAFYVTQVADPTATAMFGRRYVFNELRQKTLDVTLRADIALTPDLSIQLWMQPFLASADYDVFKELSAPGTFDFVRYGADGTSTLFFDEATDLYTADADGPGPGNPVAFYNPDFRYRSLRSNLVLRWEYVRGSTLFLVWNHGRSGFAGDPTFRLLDELDGLWGDDQQNTLLVKLNYWLSL